MDPSSGAQLEICPWLSRDEGLAKGKEFYSCDIYEDRPDDCRAYPVDLGQMLNDECEMLEADDIANHKLAKSRLKVIMSDR